MKQGFEWISFTIPQDLKRRLEAYMDTLPRKISRSDVLRTAIDEYIKKMQGKS